MRTKSKKILMISALCAVILCSFTGCKASKKKVLSSTYYKELKEEKEQLEKENKSLQEQIDAGDELTADEQRAIDYLDKIARDRLVKLEVGFADNMEGSEFVEDEAAFSMATALAKRADATQKYSPEEVAQEFGPGYQYILYDEDNAVYEINVYGGNYVVFTDLPNNVYYAYNASALGEAFLHYKNGYPNSTLLHRLADSPLVTDTDENFFENDIAIDAANLIDQMDKKKSSREAAEKVWKNASNANDEAEEAGEEDVSYEPASKEYTFYHHGNVMRLTLYDKFYSVENMDGKKTWYRAKKSDVKKLKSLFKDAIARAEDERKENSSKEETDSNENHPTHSVEIESESTANSETLD